MFVSIGNIHGETNFFIAENVNLEVQKCIWNHKKLLKLGRVISFEM